MLLRAQITSSKFSSTSFYTNYIVKCAVSTVFGRLVQQVRFQHLKNCLTIILTHCSAQLRPKVTPKVLEHRPRTPTLTLALPVARLEYDFFHEQAEAPPLSGRLFEEDLSADFVGHRVDLDVRGLLAIEEKLLKMVHEIYKCEPVNTCSTLYVFYKH